jgi:uncharacterized membrane protein
LRTLGLLFLSALAARLAIVFLIPELWGDGYSHMAMAWEVAERGVRSAPLAGYKLPFYPLLAGLAVRLTDEPYWAPRVLTALFGAATVPLLFALARRLDPTRPAVAWIAALLLGLTPSHLIFSSYAMTECVVGCFEVAAVWALLRAERQNRFLLWMAAALVPAALTRYEVWPLALAMWIQALAQRRARPATALGAAAILASAPALWLALNALGRGDPLAFMTEMSGYMKDQFYAMYPEAARRDVGTTLRYVGLLIGQAGPAALPAAVGVAALCRSRAGRAVAVPALVHFAILMALYWSGAQAGWGRYWIPLLPLVFVPAAAAIESAVRLGPPRTVRAAVTAVCVTGFLPSLGVMLPALRDADHTRQIGTFLRGTSGTVYTDEPAVVILGGPPKDRYVGSWILPTPDRARALEALRANGVRWFVWTGVDYSPCHRLFPELASRRSTDEFELVYVPPAADRILSRGMKPAYLYRLIEGDRDVKKPED